MGGWRFLTQSCCPSCSPPHGDPPSGVFMLSRSKGPGSFHQNVSSYFKCSLTQLSKSADTTINTWNSCSTTTAKPHPALPFPLPESCGLLRPCTEPPSSFWVCFLLPLWLWSPCPAWAALDTACRILSWSTLSGARTALLLCPSPKWFHLY